MYTKLITVFLIAFVLALTSGCSDHVLSPSFVAPTPTPTPVVGPKGDAGKDGSSSVVTVTVATALQCPTGGTVLTVQNGSNTPQNTLVCNGLTGATGPQGEVPAYAIAVVIAPCGVNSSPFKEALLGLAGGAIFSEFSASSDALTVRNTLLPDGSFQDTDSSHCNFNVTTAINGDRSVTWSDGNALYTASTMQWVVNY